MKVVINKCYGGYSLSPLAIKRLAELNGKQAYFFKGIKDKEPCSVEEAQANGLFFSAYSVPNPHDVCPSQDDFYSMSTEERVASNAAWWAVTLDSSPEDRADKKLIQVVEELGEAANGKCAKLVIVDIPDGTEYEIDEYDGMERISEKHRSWG